MDIAEAEPAGVGAVSQRLIPTGEQQRPRRPTPVLLSDLGDRPSRLQRNESADQFLQVGRHVGSTT